MKILSVFGTRPEAIKMAPLVLELQKREGIQSLVAVTAQHREMLDQVLELFGITPDYDLNLMRHGQTPCSIAAAILNNLEEILQKEQPDLLLVHGDTTTTMAAALTAFYNKIPCGHIEAGLRTDDKFSPFPEEVNRRATGVFADYHFAPTEWARQNLLNEGVKPDKIVVTGNTVIDALLQVVKKDCDLADYGLGDVNWQKRVILLTCHRRESWGRQMEEIFAAVAELVRLYPDTEVVFPMHKNPIVREAAVKFLANNPRIHLCEPLSYLPFSHVMNKSYLVMTDSGGMQEEAPALGKPVLVLREVTERPEAIKAGTARLAGNKYDSVLAAGRLLLEDENIYRQMAHTANPYGSGKASKIIADTINSRQKTTNEDKNI